MRSKTKNRSRGKQRGSARRWSLLVVAWVVAPGALGLFGYYVIGPRLGAIPGLEQTAGAVKGLVQPPGEAGGTPIVESSAREVVLEPGVGPLVEVEVSPAPRAARTRPRAPEPERPREVVPEPEPAPVPPVPDAEAIAQDEGSLGGLVDPAPPEEEVEQPPPPEPAVEEVPADAENSHRP